MTSFRKWGRFFTAFLLISSFIILPFQSLASVKPIEETKEKLTGISADEEVVLEKLFSIAQDIKEMKQQEERITADIDALQQQMKQLTEGISRQQQDYDWQLDILEKVLVNYQRNGPATYLEILFSADSLSKFLKSLNVLKDLSRNVGNLLNELESAQSTLQIEKTILDAKAGLLEDKKTELLENLHKIELLKLEQEQYLASLQGDFAVYQKQLLNLETMWLDCKKLFADFLEDITRIIESDYLTMEDLNLKIDFLRAQGTLTEDTFNRILKEHSKYPNTVFHFKKDEVLIDFPDKHLLLEGNFTIVGDTAIEYRVTSGTFYGLPLDQASMNELFQKGPLLIDFKSLADSLIFEFTINNVQIHEGRLVFEIRPNLKGARGILR
ncbi:hypothetical protein BHU72_07425 [Desulfuribacillus stibiiarsenatis]|uniref:N-terminal domain of peptidoglycan hydrolase CwlO-containing protein n=1 Tax=Desulfuribacillus stibiiarsenatis TaxID=1390249 RepID=A0A1E5L4W7_9FIRM|nr:hypothetical protein [Desulfuribacillus stibiiarsenatis]OEH85009.1 hypothetical protein BHU72_07425 [Desulfuribacillus stibiiarsenatis]